ncbi:aminotransferase class I/II-fold pyridoxal phosphate-dependent enzyme [Cuniculiplasma sp. SKW3]|uniref:aminotransferase class I/II-fold pyridoxal phosphate-dependent enzyme n=1 Tax=Cuniculiplasma sp. SKW3 TaxID=3400170 RepID=UPI003FD5C0D9
MENIFDNIFSWINSNNYRAKFDLTASGMNSSIFINSGIDFVREEFQKEATKMEENFYSTVSEIYGVEKNEVMSTNGGSEAIQLASLFLSRESERIIITVPEYEPMYFVPERYGFKSHRIMRDQKYELQKNESLSFTDPNNPTGDILSKAEFFKSALEDHLVYCDETFSEFRFPKKPQTNFTSIAFPNYTCNIMLLFHLASHPSCIST